MLRIISTFLLGLVFLQGASAQDRQGNASVLERRRAGLHRRIEAAQRSLTGNHRKQEENRARMALLDQRLVRGQSEVRSTGVSAAAIRSRINHSHTEIQQIETALDSLRVQYARAVVLAYKNRNGYDYLSFIFSAGSFYEVVQRVRYIQYYRYAQEGMVGDLRDRTARLQLRLNALKANEAETDSMLRDEKKQVQALEKDKRAKTVLLERLHSEEKRLAREIALRQRQDKQLSLAIGAALRTASRSAQPVAAAAPAEVKSLPSVGKTVPLVARAVPAGREAKEERPAGATASMAALTLAFERRKGALLWPVDKATLSMHFGLQTYKGSITIDNLGLTFDAAAGVVVRAAATGMVQAVLDMGDGLAVLVKHGRYFTVYSNLSEALVAKGDLVEAGQSLGRFVLAGQLEFRICDDKNIYSDPEKWLRR